MTTPHSALATDVGTAAGVLWEQVGLTATFLAGAAFAVVALPMLRHQ